MHIRTSLPSLVLGSSCFGLQESEAEMGLSWLPAAGTGLFVAIALAHTVGHTHSTMTALLPGQSYPFLLFVY